MGRSERQTRGAGGLRALKKERTRDTIVRVALELFAQRGFPATTLADIAAAAEISPSTLYAYFPTKSDILFSHHEQVLASARRRFLERPDGETAAEALERWAETELPALGEAYASALRRRRPIIDAHDELLAEERLREALLEDVFAEAFARDLQETADDLRSRLMAAASLAGLKAISLWSYRHPRSAEPDPRDAYTLDAAYLGKLLTAAEAAIEQIPRPR